MGHEQTDKGHSVEVRNQNVKNRSVDSNDFVLEKNIFNNIFEKDIRRVFIYKKAERLAKALHLVTPAFTESVSLKNRMDAVAVALVDSALLAPNAARTALSRELLTLSSMLALARTGGFLSPMNADLISREAHTLLQEVAAYEEPRLSLDGVLSLTDIARNTLTRGPILKESVRSGETKVLPTARQSDKGHIKDRQSAILSVIGSKGKASIKDISTLIRNVSEKTIQRELQALTTAGTLRKEGERRWSTYSLV